MGHGCKRDHTMPWIESHTVLIRHRKLLQVADALKIKPVTMMGHLHALWHVALEQQEDGDLTEWSNEMIAYAASFEGDPDLFVTELQAKKWLDGKVVHDWLDYAGRYLTNKYRTSNQRKLKAIFKLHKSAYRAVPGQTKGSPKSDNQPNQPNQPNQENQDNLTPLSKLWNETKIQINYKELKLPQVREMSRDRRDKETSRLKERTITEWMQIFIRICRSDFCQGKNDRTWKASFDWVIANQGNGIKVLEGKYDNP